MKILQLTKKNLDTLGFNPNLPPLNVKIWIGFLILNVFFICNLVFIFLEAKTFTEYTQSIYMGSLAILIIFAFAIIVFYVKKLFKVINDCENIVDTTLKYSASKSLFNKTARLEQKLSKIIYVFMVEVSPGCVFVAWMIYYFYIYFRTDVGNAAFALLPIPIWLPFDWKSPVGILIALTLQYIMCAYALKIGACFVAFGIGMFLYVMTMSKCIKQILFAISQSTRSDCYTEIDRKSIREQFIEYIDFASSVKRWKNCFSDIYQHVYTILFLWSLVTISGALLLIQFQMMHHSDNLAVLLITVLQVFYAFGVMFITCDVSQRANLAFDECNAMIVQFKWYLLPAEIQRMLPFIMQFAQQPFDTKIFGSVACDRETFKYVIKTAYSYFSVLRKFYN